MALAFSCLELEGFRSFRDQTTIPLKPLTLLYGQNSAGKSTIIKSLLLLQQTFDLHRRRGDHFVFSGESVDLGSFASSVTDHNPDRHIRIGISLTSTPNPRSRLIDSESDESLRIEWIIGTGGILQGVTVFSQGKPLHFTAWDPNRNSRGGRPEDVLLVLDRDSVQDFVELFNPSQTLFAEQDRLLGDLNSGVGFRPAFRCGLIPGRLLGLVRDSDFLRSTMDDYDNVESPNEGILQDAWDRFSRKLEFRLRSQFQSLAYVGPLRREPQRFERFFPTTGRNVGQQGESTLSLLYSNQRYVQRVNNYLQSMELPYEIRVRSVQSDETLGSLIYMSLVNRKGVQLAPTDVGVGYSQVLPLITQSVTAQGSLVCVEQPELHLHPAVQSRLADVFIESARAGNNVQYIIETHSEHLILRIMRRIREGRLSSADVQVLYVDQDQDGYSSAVDLPLDDHGDFTRAWPRGFFDERISEIEFD